MSHAAPVIGIPIILGLILATKERSTHGLPHRTKACDRGCVQRSV